MRSKVLFVLLALIVPGGLVALFAATVGVWLKKRYDFKRSATKSATPEAKDRAQEIHWRVTEPLLVAVA